MKIGILGSRGIPNQYGGFERFTEYLSRGLTQKGHEVYVYCPSQQKYQSGTWKGVHLIYCYDAEPLIGTAGQFIYDLNCIRDSRKRNFDLLLMLGYTSSSVWGRLLPGQTVIMSNMDGFEWKRSKYSPMVKRYLKIAEKWAVNHSDVLIADSPPIQTYYQKNYKRNAHYIPYAAEIIEEFHAEILARYELEKNNYDLVIARMEPENHIEMIIEGVQNASSSRPLIVIGKTENAYGRELKSTYSTAKVRFLGGVYDQNMLNTLRHYSRLYFHGHSVGGTNPSLLEAMAAGALIAAHDNVFNRFVLKNNAFYFSSTLELKKLTEDIVKEEYQHFIDENRERIRHNYSPERIVGDYEQLMRTSI